GPNNSFTTRKARSRMKPEELLYAETHEWIGVTNEGGRKVGTIGITAFAIEQLTDLVHMVLPKIGTKAVAGKEFGEVESVKAVSSRSEERRVGKEGRSRRSGDELKNKEVK